MVILGAGKEVLGGSNGEHGGATFAIGPGNGDHGAGMFISPAGKVVRGSSKVVLRAQKEHNKPRKNGNAAAAVPAARRRAVGCGPWAERGPLLRAVS